MRFLITLLCGVIVFLGTGFSQNEPVNVNKGFANLVEKLLPAVVSIQATQVVEPKSAGANAEGGIVIPGMPPFGPGMRGGAPGGSGNPLEEMFREFFDQMERPRKMQAVGSGFIVHCDDKVAYVISNNHVVLEAKVITVVLEDKTEIPATLLACDQRNDIAVLKLDLTAVPAEKRNLTVVKWADSDTVRAGDWAIAIGNPFNFGGTVTVGVVSYKGRYVPSGMQQDFEYIQHSAQINIGSSGGALFNVNGEVIGINTAIITNTGGNIGIGFAIPSNVARQTVEQLIKYGKIRRAHLGIRIQQMNQAMAESEGLKEPGVIIGSIIEGGPSDGKLQEGDIIVGFENKPITESHTLARLVSSTDIGKTIKLKVIRKGKPIDVVVEVAEAPDFKDEMQKDTAQPSLKQNSVTVAGLEITEIPDSLKERFKENNKTVRGVMIANVDQSKDAADLFRRGDIIEEANHNLTNSPKEFLNVIDQAKKEKRKNVLLRISREGRPAYLPLRIDEGDNDTKSSATTNKPIDEKSLEKQEPQKPVDALKKEQKQSETATSPADDKKKTEVKTPHQEIHDESSDHEDAQDADADQKLDEKAAAESSLAKDTKNSVKGSSKETFYSKVTNNIKSLLGIH